MGLLDGKVAVITGAGGGIGRAHALAFAREGARIVVNDLGTTPDGAGGPTRMADRVVEEIRAMGGEAAPSFDTVTTMEGAAAIIRTAIDAFGRIDILVNNAGILRDKTVWNMTEEMWDAVLDVHLKGTFACGQAAIRWMRDNQVAGRIINTSSYAGLKGNFGQTNYAAAKAGIYGLSMVWAQELRKNGITSNVIAPMAKTRMTEDIALIPDEMKPEHVAPVAVFLASDLARDVTGRVFGVHGSLLLEYRMEMSPGVDKGDGAIWDPREIADKLEQIGQFDTGSGAMDRSAIEALEKLPSRFDPSRAADWRAAILFDVKGAGEATLVVEAGKARVAAGRLGAPTCTVKTDATTLNGILEGKVDPQQAFLQSRIQADNIQDMMKFGVAFGLDAKQKSAAPRSRAGQVGRTFEIPEREITAAAVLAYARAIDETNPIHLDGGSGLVAPPLFPVTLLINLLQPVVSDPELGIDMMRMVHGEQSFRFHSSLKPGDRVRGKARVAAIEEKTSGETFRLDVEFTRGQETVVTGQSVLFVRGSGAGSREKKPEATPLPETRPPLFVTSVKVTDDQSRRYAPASGDMNPIHVDPKIAKAAGLKNIILHGLCTMALACRGLVDQHLGGDPSRLESFFVRFSKPVYMGDTLTTTAWQREESSGHRTLDLETRNQHGELVLAMGRAEVRA